MGGCKVNKFNVGDRFVDKNREDWTFEIVDVLENGHYNAKYPGNIISTISPWLIETFYVKVPNDSVTIDKDVFEFNDDDSIIIASALKFAAQYAKDEPLAIDALKLLRRMTKFDLET
jgi:hypothetical protein